jgi:hypothetical protein
MTDNINVRDASGQTRTMRALDQGGVYVPVQAGYDTFGDKLLVGTARERFFENFHDFDTSETGSWEVLQTGPGMSIDGPMGGGAAGASPYLRISSGVTAGSRTVLLSRSLFSLPIELRYQVTASQRIANNFLRIGFIEVDDDGSIRTSTTYSTAPEVLDARNAVVHEVGSTTATTSQLRVRAAGGSLDTFANAFGSGFTTVATGTDPNFLAATTYALVVERDKISSRAIGANVLTNTGGQFSYDRMLVNPNRRYRLVVMVDNGATAPASSTDWRLHLVNVMDAVRFDVSPRNPGITDGAKSFPTWMVGGLLTTVSTVTTVTSATITAAPLHYADTTTNLAANATFAGTVRDLGSTALHKEFTVICTSPTAGTLRILHGAATPPTIRVAETAVTANEPTQLTTRVAARYLRVEFVNGASAQSGSAFQIISAAYRT